MSAGSNSNILIKLGHVQSCRFSSLFAITSIRVSRVSLSRVKFQPKRNPPDQATIDDYVKASDSLEVPKLHLQTQKLTEVPSRGGDLEAMP
jgi:hypothetical protein